MRLDLIVGRHVDSRACHASTAVQLLAVGEPGGDVGDELVVECRVAAGRGGQVPGVDQVVGGELTDILLHVLVAVGEVDRAAGRQVVPNGSDRLGSSIPGDLDGLGAEQVTVVAVTDHGDGGATEQRSRPAVLADNVVDERPYVPVRARRRCLPLVVIDRLDPVDEHLHGAPVQ